MRIKSVETWPLDAERTRFGYRVVWEEEPAHQPPNESGVRTWPLPPLDGLQRFGYEIRSDRPVNEP